MKTNKYKNQFGDRPRLEEVFRMICSYQSEYKLFFGIIAGIGGEGVVDTNRIT